MLWEGGVFEFEGDDETGRAGVCGRRPVVCVAAGAAGSRETMSAQESIVRVMRRPLRTMNTVCARNTARQDMGSGRR